MPAQFVSFSGANVDPSRLQTTFATYLEYERARAVRKALIPRLLLFLLCVAGLTMGLHLLPASALVAICGMAAGVVAIARTVELRAKRRFSREIEPV